MFRLDTVLILGHLFRHNAHKAVIILVMACFIYIYVINVIFSCFYSCFDGLGEIWDLIFILVVVSVSVMLFTKW